VEEFPSVSEPEIAFPIEDLRAKSIKGLNTAFAFMAVAALILLTRKIVLARILLPADFGLFGFMAIVVSFASSAASLSMRDAIVQTRADAKKMLNTAFTAQLAVSLPMFLILIAFSGLISRGLHKPEMTPLLRIASVVLLVPPFELPRALFFRKLAIFKVKLPIVLGMIANASICIIMSAAGLGVWSLVTGFVLDALVNVVVIWLYSPYKPRLEFNRQIFREILRFSLPLFFITFLSWILWQGDDFMVGLIGDKRLLLAGNAALGFYSLAFYFPHQLTKIRGELAGVSFPAFSAIRHDLKRLTVAYKTLTRNSTIFMISFGAVLVPLARPTIVLLLGEKWLPSVPAFRVFMVAAVARSIFAAWGDIYKSLGKTRVLLWMSIPQPALLLALGPFITLRYGIIGVSFLILGIVLIMLPAEIYLSKKALHEINFTALLWKPAVVALIVFAVGWVAVGYLHTRAEFIAGLVGLFAFYYLLMLAADRQFRVTALSYARTSLRRSN
jgi:O-antigen/teichoic acid export membrane protein